MSLTRRTPKEEVSPITSFLGNKNNRFIPLKRNPKPDHRQQEISLDSHKLDVITVDRLLQLLLLFPSPVHYHQLISHQPRSAQVDDPHLDKRKSINRTPQFSVIRHYISLMIATDSHSSPLPRAQWNIYLKNALDPCFALRWGRRGCEWDCCT